MKKIIINNDNSIDYDSKMVKARALLFNERGNIYICNMNGSYVLPGGTVEENENSIDTLVRELSEELGLKSCNPEELVQIDYYHEEFPKYKKEGFEKRLNSVYYYLVNINSNDIGKSDFTEYEILHNDKIEEYSISDVFQLLKLPSDNKWKQFTDKELSHVLEYYLSMNEIHKGMKN